MGAPAAENLLVVNDSVSIPRSELDVRVSRSSGAGGQHVNKTSSRVEIFWNVATSRAITEEARSRLLQKFSSRLSAEGSIRVVASDMRSQARNRELAEERLAELVRRALVIPKKRKPTRPTKAAREARLEEKKKTVEQETRAARQVFRVNAPARASRTQILLAFASIYTIWGSTYLAIMYAVQTLPPFLMAGTRFLVSGLLLYVWSRSRGASRPSLTHWRNATIAGALLLVGGNGAVVWAEQSVPSGLTALLVSILPFWLVIIEWVRPPRQRPKAAVIVGLIVGFIGIIVLVGPGNIGGHGDVRPAGALVLIVGSLSWAMGSFFSRDANLPDSGLLVTGMEMLGGGVLLLILGTLLGELRGFNVHQVSRASAIGLIYLITFGSLIGFTSYIWLLDKVSPARLGTYAYVNPLVAVLLGWAIVGETLSLRTGVAAAIVICAVALITTARSADRQT